MEATDRIDFETQLTQLALAQRVPVSPELIEAYWRALQSLPMFAFTKIVDYCLSEKWTGKMPSVSQVWKLRKELRPMPPLVLQPLPVHGPTAEFDLWAIRANVLLLGYVTRLVTANPKRYCDNCDGAKFLVQAKNLWAFDMRESREERTLAYQKQLWHELMADAEHRIDGLNTALEAA